MQKNPALAQRVQQSARKVFELKQKIGLLDASTTVPRATEKAYLAALEKISQRAVTLIRDRHQMLPYKAPASQDKKPTVCAVFFAPSRFADQLAAFTKPFLEKGWDVHTYNAAFTPKNIDKKRARECAKGADLVVLGSLQWADKTNLSQKDALVALLKEYPQAIVISTMSPYDIVRYPQADTLLATYGINKYVLKTVADVILGNQKAVGTLPVQLSDEEAKK